MKSAVMPLVASLMTAFQSTAARSAGLRATPARIFALYERTSRTKLAAVRLACPLIHVLGSGKPFEPEGAPLATAIAESSMASAVVLTAFAPESGGISELPVSGVTIAAES